MNSKIQIFEQTNMGLDIFKAYISHDFQPKKSFNSPLREDKKPSFNVYKDKGGEIYIYKDFGTGQTGNAIDFVMELFGLSFSEACEKITKDFHLDTFSHNRTAKIRSKTVIKKPPIKVKKNYPITTYGKFNSSSLSYWSDYGITEDVLNKYHVVPVDSLKGTSKAEKEYEFLFKAKEPMYAYRFEEGAKIYRPHSKGRFMYVGSKPDDYVFGLDQLSDKGDILFITGGEKDVMTLRAIGYDAIALNSETASLDPKLLKKLRKRFSNIIVLYDTDETGLMAASKLKEAHKLMVLKLPFEKGDNGKDISDYIKLGYSINDLKELVEQTINSKFEESLKLLKDKTYDPDRHIPKPIPALKIEDHTILTKGNLCVIAGKVKTGKSAIVNSLIAGGISRYEYQDHLGIQISQNNDRQAVLHFETEQSEYDWHKKGNQILKQTGRQGKKPEFFSSYHLLEFSLWDRLIHIEKMFEYNHRKFGGIYLAVLDGIADLVKSVNDEEKCNEVVDFFHRLAVRYQCPIVLVLHLNPDGGKTRGHLGSQLDRKAESVIYLEKEGNATTIAPKFCRNANSIEIPLHQFEWNNTQKRHAYCGVCKKTEKVDKSEELKGYLDQIEMSESDSFDRIELRQLLEEKANLKRTKAYKTINEMLEAELLIENDNQFTRTDTIPF